MNRIVAAGEWLVVGEFCLHQLELLLYSQARLLYYRSLVYEKMDDRKSARQDTEKALAIARDLELPFINLFQQRFETLYQVTS